MNSHAVDGVRAFAVLALLALVATLPSFLWGPGVTDSAGYNYVWTKQFGDGLARGELYPRWLTQSFEGLGSPTFYFYPPLAFYLTGLVQAAGMPTLQTVNVAGAVLLFGSGAAMYAWLRFKRGHALLGACLYMAAPYHLADFYIRGALAEFAAFVWLPLIALGIEALPRRWAPPLLAFAYAALILTHLPMGLLTTVALIVPMAAHRLLKAPRLLIPFTVSGLLGLGLSAVYLFPALSLQPHITTELLWSQPYYRPQSWFLLAPWGGVSKSLLAMFASLAAAAAWLAGAAAVSAWRAGDRRPAFWGGLVIGDAALALGLFPWFWELPLMEKVQFPWRLLAIVEFAAVTAIASTKLPRPLILVIAAAVALPGLGGLTVLTVRYLARNHASPEWIAHLDRQMPDAPEYLPAGFNTTGITDMQRSPKLERYRRALATGAEATIKGDTLVLHVRGPGRVVVRRFYFPIWRVMRDDAEIAAEPFGPGRLISFQAKPGVYVISRQPLLPERLGGGVSIAALLAALALFGRRAPPHVGHL